MDKHIAYCGLDCEKCDARKATLENDNALREKVAALWTELNNTLITAEMINCVGCRADGVKTPFCSNLCPIRKCAAEKGAETCGSCEKMKDCETLSMITANNKEALDNLTKH